MIIPLVLLAFSLALAVYEVALRLPLPAAPPTPARPPTVLAPLERYLERSLHQAGLGRRLSGHALLNTMLLGAGLGGLALLPTENRAFMSIAGVVCGLMPLHLVRWQGRRRLRATRAAAEAALEHIARAYDVRRHPTLAIGDAVPKMASPMKEVFALALSQSQAGIPLPDALRALAARSGGDFYLSQFAELVAVSLRSECDLSGALAYLTARMRADAARRAEPPVWRLAAGWLGQVAAGATALALLWWVITEPAGAVICLAVAAGACMYALLLGRRRYSPRQAMIRRLKAPAWGGATAYAGGPATSRSRSRSRRTVTAPPLWQALQARRNQALIARSWPDLLAHLAMQTRAGADLPAAFAASLGVMQEPLRGHLEALVADLRTTPLPEALDAFARRCHVPGARALALVLSEQAPSGLTLADALAAEDTQAQEMARLAIRRRTALSTSATAVIAIIALAIGGFGLNELARAREVRAQALPALTAAVQSAVRAPAEARRATFLQSLAVNLPPSPPYEASLESDPVSLTGRLRVSFELRYIGRWLPPLSVTVEHREPLPKRKPRP